jgi:hypothetical protein
MNSHKWFMLGKTSLLKTIESSPDFIKLTIMILQVIYPWEFLLFLQRRFDYSKVTEKFDFLSKNLNDSVWKLSFISDNFQCLKLFWFLNWSYMFLFWVFQWNFRNGQWYRSFRIQNIIVEEILQMLNLEASVSYSSSNICSSIMFINFHQLLNI